MKRLIKLSILMLAFLTLGLNQAQAQKTNVIKLNPLSLIALHANMAYEKALNDKMSVQLGGFFGTVKIGASLDGNSGKTRYTGFGITPEYRYYITNKNKPAPEGFFVGPYALYRSYSLKATGTDSSGQTTEAKSTINSYGGGFSLGYQVIIGESFTMDFFAGPNYKGVSTKYKDNSTEEDFSSNFLIGRGSGIGVRFGMTMGVNF